MNGSYDQNSYSTESHSVTAWDIIAIGLKDFWRSTVSLTLNVNRVVTEKLNLR